MIDLDEIGYFLFMEEQENQQQLKVNAENDFDLVREQATTKEEED